jgi:endonuclease III
LARTRTGRKGHPPGGFLDLDRAIRTLRAHHGPPAPPPASGPFELVLWENVAYLASPDRRREAFDLLKREIGTSPAAILAADLEALEEVTAHGILRRTFAGKLRKCAEIAVEKFGGDLSAAIRGPLDGAKRALRAFPGIGEPGAEKILLFCGKYPFLAPDSNGLRVLVRLGFTPEEKSYAKTYAAGRLAAEALPARVTLFQEVHLLLQHHGQMVCRRNGPLCDSCPLATGCAHALQSGRASRRATSAGPRRRGNGKPRGERMMP